MLKRLKGVLLAAALVAMTGCAWAQQPATSPLTVRGVQQMDLTAKGSGRAYRVFVAVPDKPAPEAGYPVLYVLDANNMFLTALEAVRAFERRPDMPKDIATVVVGIGYPEGTDIAVARTFDLTPAGGGNPRIKAPGGGADDFLRFIHRDLTPVVGSLAKIDVQRQGIFGHSFGGLFVLHALANDPGRFRHYMAASPSVWYADKVVIDSLTNMLCKRNDGSSPLGLLVTAAEYEQKLSPSAAARPDAERVASVLAERRQVDRAREVVALVAAGANTAARFDEIAGEDHGTVIPAAISRAVGFMLTPPPEAAAPPPVKGRDAHHGKRH
ncbi:ferri-bacillibactin esterase BesA [Thermomonas brevis]